MLDDQTLQRLRQDHQTLVSNQQKIYEDIQQLNSRKLLEIRKVEERYDRDIDMLHHKLEEAKRRLPDIERHIQKREDELRREAHLRNR
jgi:hypothetical protein